MPGGVSDPRRAKRSAAKQHRANRLETKRREATRREANRHEATRLDGIRDSTTDAEVDRGGKGTSYRGKWRIKCRRLASFSTMFLVTARGRETRAYDTQIPRIVL
jgi:hypothetical protein